jgi:hypothetical protein
MNKTYRDHIRDLLTQLIILAVFLVAIAVLIGLAALLIVALVGILGLVLSGEWGRQPLQTSVLLAAAVVTILLIWLLYDMKRHTDRRNVEEAEKRRRWEAERAKWEAEARALGWQPPQTQAERYRNSFRDEVNRMNGHRIPYDPKAYYEWLDHNHKESPHFVTTVPLMAHGRADIVGDAIELMPEWNPKEHYSFLDIGGAIKVSLFQFIAMLPLPSELREAYVLLNNKEAMRAWYQEHKDRLSWNEELAKFIVLADKVTSASE